MGEKSKPQEAQHKPNDEVAKVLAEFATRFAAFETAARRIGETERTVEVLKNSIQSHAKTCSPEWVRYAVGVLIGLLVTLIGFMVTRVYRGDDVQNDMLNEGKKVLAEMQKDMGFLQGQITGHTGRLERIDKALWELELDKARREALDGRKR